MILRSLLAKTRHKFNVSVAEVEAQDLHQTIVIGVAVVSGSLSHARTVLDEVLRFVENNAEAEVTRVEVFE